MSKLANIIANRIHLRNPSPVPLAIVIEFDKQLDLLKFWTCKQNKAKINFSTSGHKILHKSSFFFCFIYWWSKVKFIFQWIKLNSIFNGFKAIQQIKSKEGILISESQYVFLCNFYFTIWNFMMTNLIMENHKSLAQSSVLSSSKGEGSGNLPPAFFAILRTG